MDSNLAELLREAITAIADHADAVRELAEAVRESIAAKADDGDTVTMDD